MKTTLFTTVSALALTGLASILTPSTLSAHQSKGGHSSSHGSHSSHSSHLPKGCRPTSYHGQRCWYGGGHYYGCNSFGAYVILDQPEVEIVEQPVEEEEVISYLPEYCETVYVGGERCWFYNGCYYRHSGHGYSKFHCKGGGHSGHTCKTSHGSHNSHSTSHGHSSHNSGHSSHSSHGRH